ncbi:MAG: glycosyltransferase [Candidatus Methylomirabilis oxygeniifera]|uniref:Glycosyltransferase subfamily 4-like N-terminal domain-containing protein n=1 Tax=Methylomirabilis oxygeniifera TaxID=671143 RepID=D5MIK3_METO1|nr:MAG: glycosyltransferase [Candidatus Methylomirabilis oxyfera]CBE67353.1 protein of unknown function [Candidatus Methylomirabilis oxyfera]
MRTLQIVHGFPPESVAGTETYCETLSRYLLARGHQCEVLTGSGRRTAKAILAVEVQNGLRVARYLRTEGQAQTWRDEYDPEAEALIRDLLSRDRPDLVHLHHWHRLTNNLVTICTDLGIPVVVTLHDVWTTCPRIHRIHREGVFCKEPLLTAPCLHCVERTQWQTDQEVVAALALRQQMVEAELSLASALIVPSEAHRSLLRELLELPENRLIVLPHGSSQTIIAQDRRKQPSAFRNRPLQIGHWGYFLYHKGTHLLLEALHRLDDPSAVQVHLIGTALESAYGERLRDLARGLSVQFHGAYQPADLRTFDLDLAVFPSITSESYSFTIDEALWLGLPVLVSDRGALSERIGKAGLTFRAEDAEDLARCLQRILDAPEALEAMRLDIRLDTLLSMEAHVAGLEKIYEDAVCLNVPRLKTSTPYLKLLANARQQIQERDAALSAAHAERDAALSAAHAELARAEQAIQQKDTDLQQVQRTVERLDAEARHYRESLEAIVSSTVWKLTAPIRWLRHPIRALPGKDRFAIDFAHLKVTLRKAYFYHRKIGLRATVRRIIVELRSLHTKARGPALCSSELLNIHDIYPMPGDISSRIAVHAHAYYPDLTKELASYLKNMPFAFDLFVSVSNDEARDVCRQAFAGLPQARRVIVDVVANRGRDIAPMVCHFGGRLATYDYICHLHTKKSMYAQGKMDGWLEYLLRQLMGSEDQVRRIFSMFQSDPRAGIIYPQNYEYLPYWGNTWLSNKALGAQMCRQMGITDVPEGYFDYPAGSMFWARSEAIRNLFSADIRLTDFPEEAGQTDGSLAHCIERLLVLVARHAGYKPFILADPLSPSWSKWRFDRYMARTRDYVKTALEAKDIKVIAFDIFDTLLVRPVLHPETAKTIIGHRNREMAGTDFAGLRAKAEALARSRVGRDVGLEDIYAEFASLTGKQVDEVGYLRTLEEEIERHLVSPRPECIDMFNHAIRSGKRVVLASDMFLPRPIIEKMLSENGIAGYHALYVSSDIGVRKDTGELYRLMLERERIAPDELLMVGDNEHSDVQVPMNVGIQVCHVLRPIEVARALPRFSGMIEWTRTEGGLDEQLVLGLVIKRLFQPVFYEQFDPARLIPGEPEDIGYGVVGPVALSFCVWLMDRAKADGIEKLYFLAREGQLLKEIYDRVAMHREDAIPSEYLVLSRRAVTVPMIESFDDICRIAKASEYFPNDLKAFFRYRYGVLLDDHDVHELCRKGLWQTGRLVEVKGDIRHLKPVLEALMEKITARSRAERPSLIAYLNRVGLHTTSAVAVVDVGYSATIQGMLSGFLHKPIHGFYMLTSAASREVCERYGVFAHGYYGSRIAGGDPNISPLWRRSFELETFLSSDDPQVICYDLGTEGQPHAAHQSLLPGEQGSSDIRRKIRRGVSSFVDDFLALQRNVYPDLRLSSRLPEMLFGEFVEHMSGAEREMISGLVLDDHYCGRGTVPLG